MRYGENDFIIELEGIFDAKNLEEASNIVFTFSSLRLGRSDEDLGYILMENYLYALTELEYKPKTIILYNEAVLLALPSSRANNYLKNLQNTGVEILLCSISVNYYQISNKITVGRLVSTKKILERKMAASKLINL